MQLMTEKSEEGKLNGLGWIPAETLKFNFNEDINLRIPHMGWNVIKPATDSKILPNTFDELKYYFVHSFYVAAKQSSIIKGTTTYGCDFTSVFEYENIFGVQFHPEKSHKYGQELFKRFLEL
jgi:glutamine amidotransferase